MTGRTDPRVVIAEALELAQRASPGPWFSNGYSGIYASVTDEQDQEYERLAEAVGPCPKPRSLENPEYVTWCHRRKAAYEADPQVAWVPAEYGDTATGRHRDDSVFIVDARTRVPALAQIASEQLEKNERLMRLAATVARFTDESRPAGTVEYDLMCIALAACERAGDLKGENPA